jgi:hypothetical protein
VTDKDADMSTLEILLDQLKSKPDPSVCDVADMLVIKDGFDRSEREKDRRAINAMHKELFGNGDPSNSIKAKLEVLVRAEEDRKAIWKNVRKVAIGTAVASVVGGIIALVNFF